MKRGRGRRRGQRWITEIPEKTWFAPEGANETEAINLTLEELEAIRLVDLLDLQQQEAAFYMGVSRKAFWNDLRSARKKVASALVYGLAIKIGGGDYTLRGENTETRPRANPIVRKESEGKPAKMPPPSKEDEITLLEHEMKSTEERLAHLKSRMENQKKKTG